MIKLIVFLVAVTSVVEARTDKLNSGPTLSTTLLTSPVGNADSCTPGDNYDPLACWLYNLHIDIPDVVIPEGIVTITLSSLYCEHLNVGSITSSYATAKTLSFGLQQLEASCAGSYHITGGIHGDVTMGVGESSSLEMGITFASDSLDYLAVQGNVTHCVSTIVIPKSSVTFTGSITAYLTNLFKGPIAKEMTKLLSTKMCDPLKAKVDPILTTTLQRIDAKLLEIVQNKPTPIPPLPEVDLVSWTDAGKVQNTLLGVNKFINNHLDAHPDSTCGKSFGGLNGLIDKYTNNTGSINVVLDPAELNTTIIVDGVGALTLGAKYANASGLDLLTNLTILEPYDKHSLISGIGSEVSE